MPPANSRLLPPPARLDARRIALLKPSALGDIVHSLPVLTALRRRFPHARIHWVVNLAYADLLRGHPDLDDVLTFDRSGRRGGLLGAARSFVELTVQLRRLRPDLVVDLQGLFRTGLLAFLSGASRRVGLGAAREGAARFYTDVVRAPAGAALHAVDRLWLIAEAFGAADDPKVFRIPIDAEARRWAAEQLAGLPRPWLAVAVGARWATKRWPPEHFASLLRRAQQRFGGAALFVGGAGDTPLSATAAAGLAGPTCNLAGRTTLPQLAAVLEAADAVVANDTGPLHLAAALGRPVVAPYTCTSVRLTGPYGAATGAVESRVWCQGSRRRRCGRMECMAELTPDRLWPGLEEVLQTWQIRRRAA
ncbi:MAG TPA: glycosyltransferase family 9 protein [Gemmataceae bacterium]|nr:glycosyltransferase family 9 protein [Gemmataceae bacterium]